MKTVLIPVELAEYVITNKLSKPFQLYMLLKSMSSGKMQIQKDQFKVLARALNRKSEKTIHNNLQILLDLNFIGFNKKTSNYYIRGLDTLRFRLQLRTRTAAEFDYADIDKLQAFCFGAVTCFIVKQQQRRKWLAERNTGRSIPANHLSSACCVSSPLLKDKLKISLNTAHRLKKKAHEAGFLELIPNMEALGHHVRYKRQLLRSWPEVRKILRVVDRMMYLQLADKIIPNIRFKRRKKIETFIQGG